MLLKLMIEKLMRGENLTSRDCQQVLDTLFDPCVNSLQVAAFLALLRAKGETAEELSAFVETLRRTMMPVLLDLPVLDIVGTGGDGLNTVNISTGSAILAASCGIKVAKHGNRAVSSLTGSADVLEALGLNIRLSAERIRRCIAEIGIGFCYSPDFHPKIQVLRPIRQGLNVATTFNMLGPLLNPAHAKHIILGVHDSRHLSTMADVLLQTGSERSVVVHGTGLDEISCVGPVKMIEVHRGKKIESTLDPLDLGLARCDSADLRGGDAALNAKLLLATFEGERGPIADSLILNAAVALYIYGTYSSIQDALSHARTQLYCGAALTVLTKWIKFSHDR
jgi:anthranilate phosphoribosyltransferase